MKTKIQLSDAEIQSGSSRVKFAEGLIEQLPRNHDGRNTWLLNYGKGEEANELRQMDKRLHEENGYDPRILCWDDETESLKYGLHVL